MDLLTPELSLFVWTIFAFIALAVFLPAFIGIIRSRFIKTELKLAWLLVVLLIPVIGPVLYYTIGRKQRVVTG